MRFAYAAVGAAGILTSTMTEGRALPISQIMSRTTSFQSRSINPYTSQQTLASAPYTPDVDSSALPASGRSARPIIAPEASVNFQNPTDSFNTTVYTSDRQNAGGSQQTGSQPIMDAQYMAGYQVGFQAGSRVAASGIAPVEQQVSALFDQNANYNAGVQAGFEAGVQQHARAGINQALTGVNSVRGTQTQPGSSSSLNASGHQNLEGGVPGTPIEQDVEFMAGRRAGYDAGVKAGSSRNSRVTTAQQAPALLGQNAIFNAGAEQGFEIGHQQHLQPDANKAVGRQNGQGAQTQGAGTTSSQVSQEAEFEAGQRAGFQAGMQSGVSGSGGQAPPGLFSQNPYFNAGAQQGFQVAEQQRMNAGINQAGSLQSGANFGQNAQSQAGLSSGLNTSGRQNLGGSQQVGSEVDAEFLAGQKVGYQAGANQGANGMSSSGQEISSLFGQNAQYNAGVQQGFAAGFQQRARANSNQSVGPQSGINASQTGQAQASQALGRQSIGTSPEPGSPVDQDPEFVAGLQVGVQAGQQARSSGAGKNPQEASTFFGQNGHFNAGVEQGFEQGYEQGASART
ncbi:uncharacterized protein MELLADRAFT_87061 [Melampsora larici-populina 98AG31]|uniref:Uncharacterized protein n=1 Tax=Melampsora larici-populina (strain 98AG31 / pathotype 3-4-7) TaxID=747676 RepID=F4R4D8_MELLP|nr:uncharacterized protein MELLADRAFT_87061 [Melampsora larici-populina 98AG31]EGG13020.1 hypothetical protein MELLADRAFT_87061 [Melampsora larici-populina 98AG31]